MTIEKWLAVAGFEGLYEVSNLGRVRSLDHVTIDTIGRSKAFKGRVLQSTMSGGERYRYATVSLSGQSFRVHHLVLTAFIGPRPDGMEGCHGPAGPSDNRLSNLRWDTHVANVRDTLRDGTHPHASKRFCPQGHEYTPDNIYRSKGGRARTCKHCTLNPGGTRNGHTGQDYGAYNRSKTHCKHGHEFTPENTRRHTRGGRRCLACDTRNNRNRAKKKTKTTPTLRIINQEALSGA